MKKIIVTGGAGFISSHLIEKLLNETDTSLIYAIDNLERTKSLRNIQHLLDKYPTRLKFIHADISTFDFESIIDPFQIEYVFHLASPRINKINEFNLEGHTSVADAGFRLVNWISKYSGIKLFFASSASVYQSPKRFPMEETDNCNPYTIYGAGKFYTENIIRSYKILYGLDYTINRFFSVYGARMDNEGVYTEVVFNWLNQIKNGNTHIKVHGNPDEKVIDLVYVSDVVNAICLSTFNTNHSTFNVSSESGTTLSELLKIISKVTGKELEVSSIPDPRKDVELKRVGSVNRLKAIGWKPNVSVEEGITKTWEWING